MCILGTNLGIFSRPAADFTAGRRHQWAERLRRSVSDGSFSALKTRLTRGARAVEDVRGGVGEQEKRIMFRLDWLQAGRATRGTPRRDQARSALARALAPGLRGLAAERLSIRSLQ